MEAETARTFIQDQLTGTFLCEIVSGREGFITLRIANGAKETQIEFAGDDITEETLTAVAQNALVALA